MRDYLSALTQEQLLAPWLCCQRFKKREAILLTILLPALILTKAFIISSREAGTRCLKRECI